MSKILLLDHWLFCYLLRRLAGRKALLLLMVFVPLSFTYGQNTRTVSGQVTSLSDGATLPGVNILIQGRSAGTVTDVEGNYSIQVSATDDTLVFSSIGYLTEEVAINGRDVINITLSEDIKSLSEVVVIGYGTAEKKEITSSVASVDAKEFNRGNVNDPAQLLQGKVAGLSIAKPGGDPNAGFNIRLRGLSTFGANSQPLIVIDGVVGGSLQTVDPNDIASIEVLKDASAAAIYGTRGASGVIIVTTKKGGVEGTSAIDYNGYVALEEVARFVPNSTPEQFIEAGGQDNGYETDWLDLVTQTGVSNVHNVSLSNSSKSSSYRVSVNYRDVEGIAKGSGFDQLNGRLNLTQRAINDRLNLTANLGITRRRADFVNYEALRFAIIADPTAPIYLNNDPSLGYWEPSTPEYHNPMAIINEVTDDGNFKTFLGSLRADFEIFDGLNVGAFYSQQYESDMRSQYFSSRMRFNSGQGRGGLANKFSEDRINELFELTGSFKRQLGKLGLNTVVGYSWQELTFENFRAENGNFITDDLLYNNLELGLDIANNLAAMESAREESRLISYFGRVILNFDDTYFLTAAYRREGSSKFGANNRWGNFYSFSGGVDIQKLADLPMDVLKLRAGYGITGNIPNQNYEYLQRLAPGSRFLYNGSFVPSFGIASNPNPDLKWEQKAETNIGLDFAFMNNRLNGSVDYYIRDTDDVLQTINVPVPPNFFGTTLQNVGELKSNGLEVLINYLLLQNNEGLTYNTGVTFSTFNTELVTLNNENTQVFLGNLGPPGLNGTLVIRLKEGEPIGDIMAPIFLGLDEDGQRILQDQNEDGNITQIDDAVVVGNGLPDFELSWNNSLTYRSFDLNFVMRGAFGHSLVNINRAYYESPAASNNYNPVRTKYYLPDLNQGESWNSYYVEKADFFKLDNVTLGYNMSLGENSILKNLRLYVTGQNLFVITDYTGVDPEVHYDYGGNQLAPGVDDRNSYFRTRTYTLGVNVGF